MGKSHTIQIMFRKKTGWRWKKMEMKNFILKKNEHWKAGNYSIAEGMKEEPICTIEAKSFAEAAASLGAKITGSGLSENEMRIEFCYEELLKSKRWEKLSEDSEKITFTLMPPGRLLVKFDAKTKKPADNYTTRLSMDCIYNHISYYLQCLPKL